MYTLLARAPFTGGTVQINHIEQFVHIHICNVAILLSENMIKKTNWNYRSKYFLSGMILASILLLSSFSILTHNAFANAMINSVQTNDHSNTSTNAQSNSNIKNTDSTGANSKPAHVKSPPHIPPLILEQFMESKICKSKCIHPKSP